MTEVENNPYQPLSLQESSATLPTANHGRNALKAAIIGPTMLFPVFMFYGAVHGCSGLFGGQTHYGMEGLRRGLLFAGVLTITIFWPIVLGIVSSGIGFLCSLLVGNRSPLFWSLVTLLISLIEYAYLVSRL